MYDIKLNILLLLPYSEYLLFWCPYVIILDLISTYISSLTITLEMTSEATIIWRQHFYFMYENKHRTKSDVTPTEPRIVGTSTHSPGVKPVRRESDYLHPYSLEWVELYPHSSICVHDFHRDKFIYRAPLNVVINIWNAIKDGKFLTTKE